MIFGKFECYSYNFPPIECTNYNIGQVFSFDEKYRSLVKMKHIAHASVCVRVNNMKPVKLIIRVTTSLPLLETVDNSFPLLFVEKEILAKLSSVANDHEGGALQNLWRYE